MKFGNTEWDEVRGFFCGDIGLFCGDIGLIGGDMGLFGEN